MFAASGDGRWSARTAGSHRLDDDVAELLRSCEPAQRVDGQLEGLVRGERAAGRSPGGASRFWFWMAAATSLAFMLQRRHLLRVEPGTHAVVALAQKLMSETPSMRSNSSWTWIVAKLLR